ncbi:hypothetical protein [Thermaurantiacus sp.]
MAWLIDGAGLRPILKRSGDPNIVGDQVSLQTTQDKATVNFSWARRSAADHDGHRRPVPGGPGGRRVAA